VPLLISDGWILGSGWEERQVLARESRRTKIFKLSLHAGLDCFWSFTI
jgi:hypothetical protein